jgi:hypothetical protein
MGQPPSGGCLWSHRARRVGPHSGRCLWSRPRLRLRRRCRVQRLVCTVCRVVEVLHHRALLLLRWLRFYGRV